MIIGIMLPSSPGTYALVLACDREDRVRIGRLATVQLRPGVYVYIGSALGAGGLAARIGHHLRAAARPRWHLDYLRGRLRIMTILYACGTVRQEHEWAALISGLPGAEIAVRKFGSSDCSCATHLYWFPRFLRSGAFRRSPNGVVMMRNADAASSRPRRIATDATLRRPARPVMSILR